jgi:hypothetical protein
MGIGILFTLSLMSFTFAASRGISELYFVLDEQWNLGYFFQGMPPRSTKDGVSLIKGEYSDDQQVCPWGFETVAG